MNDTACLIPLTQGKFATVDAIDYDWLMQWKWHAKKGNTKTVETWYAYRGVQVCLKPVRKIRQVSMHYEVAGRAGLKTKHGYDHKNHDGTDNRRTNIRPATQAQNIANSRKRGGCSSRFKGVSWNSKRGKWNSHIYANGHSRYIGLFEIEEDAAMAYTDAAKKAFGEFAHF